MRDLKRLWRKDDTDDERTVFRCFAKAGLCTELVSLLDECTGRGQSGRKMALAAADLLAALTWPIDVQQELKDMLEDAETVVTDYASLRRSQVEYKVSEASITESKGLRSKEDLNLQALIMKSGSTIRNLMVLLLPSLALSNR
jgi:replication fork protection complex subunit Tof1/Swi1